jgi:hypothetical protein
LKYFRESIGCRRNDEVGERPFIGQHGCYIVLLIISMSSLVIKFTPNMRISVNSYGGPVRRTGQAWLTPLSNEKLNLRI